VAVGVRQRASHYLALAGVAVALALAIARITTGWDSMNWLFVAFGAVCAAVGTVRLALFIRAHPRATAEGM
jgi:MFS superfamily sulfate permease-like transporter